MSNNAEKIYNNVLHMLETATENVEKVYNTGYKLGIRDGGYEDGKKAEYNAFWDSYQNAKRKNWSNAFQDKSWNDTTFFPKYDIKPVGIASALFRYCGITDLEGRLNECGVILDTSGATLNCAFGESTITRAPTIDVTNCKAASDTNGLFSGCVSLKSIKKIIIDETIPFNATAFGNCPALEDITFEGTIGCDIDFRSCKQLTKESIMSIVNHLAPRESDISGKTLTLSKTAVDREFEGVGAADFVTVVPGSDSLEWYNIITFEKPNWEFNLV